MSLQVLLMRWLKLIEPYYRTEKKSLISFIYHINSYKSENLYVCECVCLSLFAEPIWLKLIPWILTLNPGVKIAKNHDSRGNCENRHVHGQSRGQNLTK